MAGDGAHRNRRFHSAAACVVARRMTGTRLQACVRCAGKLFINKSTRGWAVVPAYRGQRAAL